MRISAQEGAIECAPFNVPSCAQRNLRGPSLSTCGEGPRVRLRSARRSDRQGRPESLPPPPGPPLAPPSTRAQNPSLHLPRPAPLRVRLRRRRGDLRLSLRPRNLPSLQLPLPPGGAGERAWI